MSETWNDFIEDSSERRFVFDGLLRKKSKDSNRNTALTFSPRIQTRPPHVRTRLPVAPQRKGVLSLPGVTAAGLGVVVAMALVETTALLAGGSETAHLAVLVDRVDDPVDASITADGLVLGVDEDDLVVLVGAVLVDPVAVENAQVGAATTDTLLSSGLERALVLELVHTLVGGLACNFQASVFVLPRTLFLIQRLP